MPELRSMANCVCWPWHRVLRRQAARKRTEFFIKTAVNHITGGLNDKHFCSGHGARLCSALRTPPQRDEAVMGFYPPIRHAAAGSAAEHSRGPPIRLAIAWGKLPIASFGWNSDASIECLATA